VAPSEIAQMYESEADAWHWQGIEPERLINAWDQMVVFQREYQRDEAAAWSSWTKPRLSSISVMAASSADTGTWTTPWH
jgi:hypothetical protein